MTTMYGTIPTLSSDALQAEPWSGCERDLGRIRPWNEMLSALSFPDSFDNTLSRINTNVAYFHMNYVIILVCAICFSLLWHPVSLVVFVVLMFAWLFLYFLRHDSIVIFGYEVYGRVVVTIMSILTVVLLVTRATTNVATGLSVGLAVAVVHGACRKPDHDMILGDQESGVGAGGRHTRVDMKETTAASFSSSSYP